MIAWVLAGAAWGAIGWALVLIVGGIIRIADSHEEESPDDDDCDDQACPDWDCDECRAQIQASKLAHPSSRRYVQDPFTQRTWLL